MLQKSSLIYFMTITIGSVLEKVGSKVGADFLALMKVIRFLPLACIS